MVAGPEQPCRQAVQTCSSQPPESPLSHWFTQGGSHEWYRSDKRWSSPGPWKPLGRPPASQPKARSGSTKEPAEWKPPGPLGHIGESGHQQMPIPRDKFYRHLIQSNPIQRGGSWNRRGGRPQAMMLQSGVPEAAPTHWRCPRPKPPLPVTTAMSHPQTVPPRTTLLSCPTKAAGPCWLFKMCAAEANSRTASFYPNSQHAPLPRSDTAVTLLEYASRSTTASPELARPPALNCSIAAPSPPTTAALSRALGHDSESPSYFWFGFVSSALVSKEYPD